jgi:hypothetical protein
MWLCEFQNVCNILVEILQGEVTGTKFELTPVHRMSVGHLAVTVNP